jgi:hypothetical protein
MQSPEYCVPRLLSGYVAKMYGRLSDLLVLPALSGASRRFTLMKLKPRERLREAQCKTKTIS